MFAGTFETSGSVVCWDVPQLRGRRPQHRRPGLARSAQWAVQNWAQRDRIIRHWRLPCANFHDRCILHKPISLAKSLEPWHSFGSDACSSKKSVKSFHWHPSNTLVRESCRRFLASLALGLKILNDSQDDKTGTLDFDQTCKLWDEMLFWKVRKACPLKQKQWTLVTASADPCLWPTPQVWRKKGSAEAGGRLRPLAPDLCYLLIVPFFSQTLFKKLDTDKSGCIETYELANAFKTLGECCHFGLKISSLVC